MTRRLISMVIAALMVLALVPMSIFAKTEGNLKDPIMSYYGDGIEVNEPKVGDYTYFPVYISPNSSLYSFDVMVEYNSAYLNPVSVMYKSSANNATYPQLYMTIKNSSGVSDNYGIANENACQYDGATNPESVPVGELGKTYARVLGYALTNNYGGIQLGGKENGALFWVKFQWVAIPAQSCVLPMPITNVSSANAEGVEYADVACDDGAASYMDVTVTEVPPTPDVVYYPVTATSQLDEDYYVIVAPNDGEPKAMNNEITSNKMGSTDVTINANDQVVNPDPNAVWWFEKQSDGTWAIFNEETGVYCYINRNNSSGFVTNEDESEYFFTITVDPESAYYTTMKTNAAGNRCVAFYAANNDFRAYAETASQRTPIRLYKLTEPEEPELPPEFDGTVTFTGETVDQTTANVGGSFTWDLSVSAASKLFSGAWRVDYDERYLEPDEVMTAEFDGSVYDAASASSTSDIPAFMDTVQTVDGNDQWRLSMYLGTAEGLGVTEGGVMGRFAFNWKAFPAMNDDGVMQDENGYYLPMTITVVESTYSTGDLLNGIDYGEENITVINGKIYITPTEPEEVGVTFTGETKNAGEVAEGDTVTWDLSVSAGSKLFSGAWLVDYDENYLEPDEVWTSEFTGSVYDAASESSSSDIPAFMDTVQTVEGNDQWRLSMYLGTADGYGVTEGGVMGRFIFNWKAVPTADSAGVMHDDNGYYLPMTITVKEATYSTGSLTNGTPFAEDEITVIHGKIYFTPVQTATLTINYLYADGTQAAEAYTHEYNVGDEYSVTSPVIEGYTASQAVVSGTMGTADVEVTVIYEVNTYTITYIVDGEIVKVDTYAYGAEVTPYEYTAPEGTTFSGWDGTVPETMPAENLTFTGTTTVNTYTITYNINGEYYTEQTYAYGAEVTAPEYEVPFGYNFSGWTTPETMPAEDITLDATLTPKTYRIWVYYLNAETEYALVAGEYYDLPYGTVQSFMPKDIEGWVCTNPEEGLNYTVTGNGEIEFLYIPVEVPYEPVPPTVTGDHVETRPRATEDGKTDLRFVFKVTFNDSYVLEGEDAYGPTQEYYKITKLSVTKVQGSGSPKELVCKNLFTVEDLYCTFTVVIKGIPESYNDLVFTMTPHIEYELNGQTYTADGEPLVTSVNSLAEGD